MEIKGKTSAFTTMLAIVSLNKMFDEIVIDVGKKNLVIVLQSGADTTSIMSRAIFNNFEIKTEEPKSIGIKVGKILGYLKDIFSPDDEIVWTTDKGDLIISGGMDVIRIALLEPKSVKNHPKSGKLSFKIDEEKKVALYKKGEQPPLTTATMDATVLQDIAKRAGKVGQEYYPINLETPNKIHCAVGSRKKDKTKDTIEYSRDDILVEGEEMSTVLGYGFKEITMVLKGDVLISGVPTSVFGRSAPMWIFQATDDYEVGFFVAPRAEE